MLESVSERLIREAMERGEFDDLPGTGKPIQGLDKPYDPDWWVKSFVERERSEHELQARYQRLEARLAAVPSLPTEAAVRRLVERVNAAIVELDAGEDRFQAFDVEDVVAAWRASIRRRRPKPRKIDS